MYASVYKKLLNRLYDPWLYLNWYLLYSSKLRQFKNIHKGKSCFIIGNGPSLNRMDLTLLKNSYTFGSNKIFLIFDKVKLDLSYYVAINGFIIRSSKENIMKFKCPCFLNFNTHKLFKRKKDNHFFIWGDNKNNNLDKLSISFQKNIERGTLWHGRSVTYIAMQIAYYMGFKNIFLIGCDFNYAYDCNPGEITFQKGYDPNHFDPRYHLNENWVAPEPDLTELSFRLAKLYFERSNRKIYDATVGGKLNVFPKSSFKEALRMSSKKTYSE